MKIVITSIEGHPAEIAEVPQLQAVLAHLTKSVGDGGTERQEQSPVTDGFADIESFIRSRGGRRQHVDLVTEFVRRCSEFDGVEVVPGRSKTSPDGFNNYLMLRHVSHVKGSFVYVTPSSSKLSFRLSRDEIEGRAYAVAVDTRDESYQVRLNLTSHEMMDEAIDLAARAYAGVLPS